MVVTIGEKIMSQFAAYRTAELQRKLACAGFRPLDVMLIGATGAGKSSTLNALFESGIAKVGDHFEPQTMKIDCYDLCKGYMRFWDTPGLGDDVLRDKAHAVKISDLLRKSYRVNQSQHQYGFIDMALMIVDGSSRDLGTIYQIINNLLIPNIQHTRILIALNQCDLAMKRRHWDATNAKPEPALVSFLEEATLTIQQRVKRSTGFSIPKPIYYSATSSYNIYQLLDFIIDHTPATRRTF